MLVDFSSVGLVSEFCIPFLCKTHTEVVDTVRVVHEFLSNTFFSSFFLLTFSIWVSAFSVLLHSILILQNIR